MMTDFVVVLFCDSWQDSVWSAVFFLVTILVSMIVFFWFVFTLQSGGVYMFSNLIGCDGERVFYDGGSMISVNGQIIAEGPQFTLDEVVRSLLCVLFSLWDLLVFFSLIKFKWTKCMQIFFFPLNIYLKHKSGIIILKNHWNWKHQKTCIYLWAVQVEWHIDLKWCFSF